MRYFACLLLIGSLLVQRAALPHSHAGSGVMEPEGHDLRPHIHLSLHGHRHHACHRNDLAAARRCEPCNGISGWCHAPLCDHDDDAVYVSVDNTVGLAESADGHVAPAASPAAEGGITADALSAWHFTWAPPRYGPRVPYFLASTILLV